MGSRDTLWRLIAALMAGAIAAPATAACAPERLDLQTPDGSTARFSVEIADDGAERAIGLMHRPAMATMAGMLFVYDAPHPVSFWMKNTLIPLDMIFADATGTVTRVFENAQPGNLVPVDGGAGVQYVLEINAGMARKLGIAPGSTLRHPAIAGDGAAWPCR